MYIELIDTHAHIHSTFYKLDPDKVIKDAQKEGVTRVICVGTDLEDSKLAIEFVAGRSGAWASIGIHPHEADKYQNKPKLLAEFASLVSKPKVVAVGECGLDYFYDHSSHAAQEELLRFQIELALKNNLPLIFHVREAFEDFWKILDDYKNVNGVVHSFSTTKEELDRVLKHHLFVGLNGIMTFAKNDQQLEAAKAVPLDKLLLETDAPFLTPAPYRGTIAELKHVRVTAEFLSSLRGESLQQLASQTTRNALRLFKIN